jgi:ribosomal protein L7/L12
LGIVSTEGQRMADKRVIEMLRKGNKIEAIKIYREIYNVGLAEAKDAVDDMERRFGL